MTGYVIESYDLKLGTWVQVEKVTKTSYTVTVPRIEGKNYFYQFRVSAENLAGVGEASEPTKPITPYGNKVSYIISNAYLNYYVFHIPFRCYGGR